MTTESTENERIDGFCPDYCHHAPCPHRTRQCEACDGPLDGPDAPFPRCVSCDSWEDECACPRRWTYMPEIHEDMCGADTIHHIVSGDRHIAQVESEEDARLIVRAVNALRFPSGKPGGSDE